MCVYSDRGKHFVSSVYWSARLSCLTNLSFHVLILSFQEVTTLNKARSNDRVTSNADLDYPFCEPSSRPSTTMDYYHLLLTGVCTPNKPQVFTAIGMQLPGQYLKRCDKTKPLGATVTAVYRSWAFTQKSLVEEFITDDGKQSYMLL